MLKFNLKYLQLSWKYRNRDKNLCCCGQQMVKRSTRNVDSWPCEAVCRSLKEYSITSELEAYHKQPKVLRYYLLSVLIILLTFCDAYLTLNIIELGGSEANPIMQYFLDYGDAEFLFAKGLIVFLGMCVLLGQLNHKRIPVRKVIISLSVFMVGLVGYDLYVLHQVKAII